MLSRLLSSVRSLFSGSGRTRARVDRSADYYGADAADVGHSSNWNAPVRRDSCHREPSSATSPDLRTTVSSRLYIDPSLRYKNSAFICRINLRLPFARSLQLLEARFGAQNLWIHLTRPTTFPPRHQLTLIARFKSPKRGPGARRDYDEQLNVSDRHGYGYVSIIDVLWTVCEHFQREIYPFSEPSQGYTVPARTVDLLGQRHVFAGLRPKGNDRIEICLEERRVYFDQ